MLTGAFTVTVLMFEQIFFWLIDIFLFLLFFFLVERIQIDDRLPMSVDQMTT